MILAKSFGLNVKGIELDPKLITRGEELFGLGEQYFFQMNAFDFNKYGDYDIIYYYCPLQNNKEQTKLELLIEEKMKVGAYLIPMLKQDNTIKTKKDFKIIKCECGGIYQKIKPKVEND